ncbi:MAG TPA: PQQ-dependent sugar dehydrogenase [Solirubrobacteraceae bacterium]|nr:PQQ-dependent sugar dehydrogenase [Solirubrobacteraceae bacterium]
MRASSGIAGLVVVALVGCGGDERDAAERSGAATKTATASAPARVAAASRAPRVSVVARDLVVPWDVAFLPDRRALVTERPGRVRLISAKGRLQRRAVARVPTTARGEGGLLGIAVDPAFAEGRRFIYLYVTTRRGMQVQRWRFTGRELRRDAVVLGGIAAGAIHDSGRLRFGPDRRLYVATGDAGRGQLAQRRGSRNGKILRLSPRQYRGRGGRPEIFSLGHRNPQGLDWQPGSRRLFTTDHGPSGFDGPSGDDEVNAPRRGSNHGWPRVRGRRHGRFAAPVRVYRRTLAPSGLAFVKRSGSTWTGDLMVAALKGRQLRRLELDGRRVVRDTPLLAGRYGRLRAVVEAPDGALWVTTSNRDGYGSPVSRADDRILRIAPPAR